MRAVLTKALADFRRRRLQSAIVALIVLLASATGAIALNLIAESSAPYDRAFKQQHGAHLLTVMSAKLVTPERFQQSAQQVGAEAVGGPWPTAMIAFEQGRTKYSALCCLVSGRADPGGPVEVLKLTAGRWVRGEGEIVLTRSFAESSGIQLGDRITALSVASRPALTVVGEAADVDVGDAQVTTQPAWVTPGQIDALSDTGTPPTYLAVVRFPGSPDDAALSQKTGQLRSLLPPGSLLITYTYLTNKMVFDLVNTLVLTFLLAFSVIALVAAGAIVANLVAGVVLASYREIGIMKAIGFGPVRVIQVFVAQMLLPALAGCAVGIPLGSLLSQPLLQRSAHALGLPSPPAVSLTMDLLVLAGVLLVVAVSALVPALRAGLLSAVQAIATGSAPQASRGSPLGAAAVRLRLPRSISLGFADSFARPLRGALTVLGILVGVATLVFAYGLRGSLQDFNDDLFLQKTVQVQIARASGYPDSSLMATLQSEPDTANVVASYSAFIGVPGIPDPVSATAFRGRSDHLGYRVTEGRWFSGPGEVVAPERALQDSHHKVGDSFTAIIAGQPVQLRIVGTYFDVVNFGRILRMDASTLTAVAPDATPDTYYVQLRPGADAAAYARRVQATEPDFLSVQVNSAGEAAPLVIVNGVMAVLAVVLVLIAVAGVFTTAVLNSRERFRDIAILKALGMRPGQVVVMMAASACLLGAIGGLLGLPAGIVLHHQVIAFMGGLLGTRIPPATLDVFDPLTMPLFLVAGLVTALAGALLPARWAARGRVTTVLQAE